MSTSPDCAFYLKGGKCGHFDAPNPGHSWCIGKEDCPDYQKAPTPLKKALDTLFKKEAPHALKAGKDVV